MSDLETAIAVVAELHDELERAAWTPRERVPPSLWAPRNRVFRPAASPSHPGEFEWLAPWMPGLCDLLCDPRVNWLTILKAAQVGVSELVRTAIGWSGDLDPKPVLWVMTTEKAAEAAMEKLRWMLEDTPCLAPLVLGDVTLEGAELSNGMRIGTAWAGSPQAMASDPWCWVVLDEVAKYKAAVGGEGAIVKNAAQRVKVFRQRGKVVLLSSPRHENDNVCTSHEAALDKRRFYVPCPSCRKLQPLDWEWVRWPGGDPTTAPTNAQERLRAAARVRVEQSAWIECRFCGGRIDSHAAMNDPAAAWARELEDGGHEVAPEPRSGEAVGVQISELYHWKSTVSDLAGKFLSALTPLDLADFWNGCLGLPYVNSEAEIAPTVFSARAIHAPKVAPSWSTTILATADTQLDGWWVMVRAWGRGRRSRLLDWGFVRTEAELLQRTLGARFDVEGSPELEGRPLYLAVDTGGGMDTPDGSRTSQVYMLAWRTKRVLALKGEGRAVLEAPWRRSKVAVNRLREGLGEVEIHLVNRSFYADELATLIRASEPVLWEECRGAGDPVYVRQMASERRVLVTSASGSELVWQKRSKGAPNHLWDCARYQCWLAEYAHVEQRTETTWTPRASAEQAEQPLGERHATWKIGRR